MSSQGLGADVNSTLVGALRQVTTLMGDVHVLMDFGVQPDAMYTMSPVNDDECNPFEAQHMQQHQCEQQAHAAAESEGKGSSSSKGAGKNGKSGKGSGQFKGTGSGQFKGKGKSKSKAQQDKWAAQCNGMTVAMIRRKRKQHSDPCNKVQNKERSMRRDKKKEKFQKALRNAMCIATTNMSPVSEDESLVPSTIKQARLAVLLEEKLAERPPASHESMDVATSHKAMDADFETSHQAMDVDFDPNGVPKTPDDDTESESEAASPEYSYLCDKTCE